MFGWRQRRKDIPKPTMISRIALIVDHDRLFLEKSTLIGLTQAGNLGQIDMELFKRRLWLRLMKTSFLKERLPSFVKRGHTRANTINKDPPTVFAV